MNVRELYARDTHGGLRGKGIDTGFGLSASGHNAGEAESIEGDIIFADVGPAEEQEETEDIRLEARCMQFDVSGA